MGNSSVGQRSWTGVAAALACLTAAVTIGFVWTPLGAQAPATAPAAAGSSAAPVGISKDLSGTWGRITFEPLQRSAANANKELLTEEERAALDQKVTTIVSREADPSRRKRGSEQDVGGAYNSQIYTSHLPTGPRTSMIIDPPDGRIPPLTPEAQKRNTEMRDYALALVQSTEVCRDKLPGCPGGKVGPPSPRRFETPPHYLTTGIIGGGGGVINRSDGPEDRGHGERCMAGALPDFGGYRRIVQSGDLVNMFYDVGQGQGWQRTIPISDRPHVPANVKLWWGDSRARWDGNTLVVDVTNFSEKSSFQGSREGLHLVERWTRTDKETLVYEVKIEDPTVWTRSWTVRLDFKLQDDKVNRFYREPRCHEGNYGMASLLLGARSDELAFKQGKGPNPALKCTGACGGFAGGFADEGDDANPR